MEIHPYVYFDGLDSPLTFCTLKKGLALLLPDSAQSPRWRLSPKKTKDMDLNTTLYFQSTIPWHQIHAPTYLFLLYFSDFYL